MNKLDSILVGKAIVDILNNDAEVKEVLDEKIFPLVADENTSFPFMVYRRSELSTEKTKDGYFEHSVSMEFAIGAESYGKSLNVAQRVANALIGKRGTFSGIDISGIDLSNAQEDYIDDAYIQNLVFNIKIE